MNSTATCSLNHWIFEKLYCRSGNFGVFKFSRISDLGAFHEVYNLQIYIFLKLRYRNNNYNYNYYYNH